MNRIMSPKAQEAARLLESDLFREVMDELRQDLKDEWEREPSNETRERLHAQIRVLPKITEQLKKIRDREVTEIRMEERRKRRVN